MSVEANKALIRRLIDEVVNGGNLDAFDELVAPDFVNTGRHIILDGMTVFQVVNGQISERWGVLDMLGVRRQLGLAAE